MSQVGDRVWLPSPDGLPSEETRVLCDTCAAETHPGPVCARCAALAQLTQPVLRLETRRRPPVPPAAPRG